MDIDNNNKLDLIVADGANPAVSILLNNSTGPGNLTFAGKYTLSTGYFSYSAVGGDMNGDGKIDLVVANSNNYSLSVFKNNSAGSLSFSQPAKFTTQFGPWVALTADLDNDGMLDIATANHGSGNISILRNRVGQPIISSFDPSSGGNGATININGAKLDQVLQVYFGKTPAKSFTIVSPEKIVATVDSGTTGKVKVVGVYGTDSLDGFTFTTNPTITSFTPSSGGVGTVVNISGTNLNNVTAVKFGNLQASSFIINSPTSMSAVVGAVDSIIMEISVTNPGGSGTANGFYTGPSITSFTPKSGPTGSVVTINGYHFSSDISKNKVYLGGESAKIIEANTNYLKVIVPAYTSFDPIIVLSDSLIAYSKEPFIVTFPTNNSEFNSNSLVIKGDSATGRSPISVSNADFDGDGKTDIVVANSFVTGSFSILKNNSEPGYISFKYKTDFPTIRLPFKVITGDIDRDGKPDIIVLNELSNSVSVLKNTTTNGVFSFGPEVEYATGNSPRDIKINDMDGDGKPDLIVLILHKG